MNRAPYNFYSPKPNGYYGPGGQLAGRNNYPSRNEDSLDTFRKEQQLLSKSHVLNRSNISNNDLNVSTQRDGGAQYPYSANQSPLQNHSSPTLSNGKTGEFSSPSKFYSKAFDQTNKYETNTPGQLPNLNYEILTNQRSLEQNLIGSRSRSYNILSNKSYQTPSSSNTGSYGSALKALWRNQEDTRRVLNNQGQQGNSSFTGTYNHQSYPHAPRAVNFQEPTRYEDGSGNAGKYNDYKETQFRYANKTMNQAPLSQDQMYGIKALKNLSGMKLY